MNCCQISSILDDLIDRSISETDLKSVKEHLNSCSKCKSEVEASTRLKKLLGFTSRQVPQPDDLYFSDITNLILARTVENDQIQQSDYSSKSKQVSENEKRSFYRSIFSAATSIAVLTAALWVGSPESFKTATILQSDEPIYLSASLEKIATVEFGTIITHNDQIRLAKALTLIGSPGIFGRTSMSALQFDLDY